MAELASPAEGIAVNLAEVDKQMSQLGGNLPVEIITARGVWAQAYATCALTHAVRELTEEVRKLGPEEG